MPKRDLVIEEALQIEIKATLSHNNQLYEQWCALSDEEINKNKVKITVIYDMGWQKRSYHLEGDNTRLAGMPSSSVGYLRELLVWSSIQRPAKRKSFG